MKLDDGGNYRFPALYTVKLVQLFSLEEEEEDSV